MNAITTIIKKNALYLIEWFKFRFCGAKKKTERNFVIWYIILVNVCVFFLSFCHMCLVLVWLFHSLNTTILQFFSRFHLCLFACMSSTPISIYIQFWIVNYLCKRIFWTLTLFNFDSFVFHSCKLFYPYQMCAILFYYELYFIYCPAGWSMVMQNV